MSRFLFAAALAAALLTGPGAALAGPRLDPIAGPGVTLETREGRPVAFSRQPASAVALMIEQGSYASHDRPTLVLSLANGGKAPVDFGAGAISVATAGGDSVRLFSAEEIRAEAEHDAKVKAEMRTSEAYASAERSYSSQSGVLEGGAEASKSMLAMADATRGRGVLAGYTSAPGQTGMGLRPLSIAPGQVVTVYIPLRKLGRGDADLMIKVTLGGETHLLPLRLGR